jgi:hypothetical protein
MFNTSFDIRNVWIITMIIVIIVLISYIYISSVFRKRGHTRLYSNYTQTDDITIVEYNEYGQPFINGYQVVLYGHI